MNSAIPSSCMDRYLNRYIVPHHPAQQQQQQQQLLNQQAAAAVAVAQNPNGFYQHQLLQQQQQQHHHQQQQQQQQQVQGHAPPPQNFMVGCYSSTNGWAGVPLISTAARRPRKFPSTIQNVPINHYQPASNKAEFDENAMSRLALHAHGAPLILANNRYRSNPNKSSGHPNKPKQVPSRDDHSHHQNKFNQNSANPQAVMSHPNDTHSVASDESSLGTTNSSSSSTSSDTCLPRIIKPRKRRKKDRKPNVQNVTPISGGSATTVTSSTTSTLASSHPLSMGPGQLSANSALLLDETTRDFLNEIALIANAGGHFDFSGLPLIREQTQFVQQQQQQQQQQLQMPPAQLQSQEQSQHFSSNNSDSSDSGINSLACSCRLCDPFGKIWAFPLRRSCSDNSAEIELNRAKDVGVIGSNRSNSFRSEWRSSPHSLDQPGSDQRQLSSQQPSQQEFGSSSSRKGSFSDSGDSGCDLLSGLTFCSEDILSSVNRELFMTPVDASKEFQFPSSTVPGSGGGGGGSGGNVVNNNSISGCVVGPGDRGDNSELLLISELTKKMNEGLDLGSSGSSDSGSGSSSSVFADGGMYNGGSSGGSADGSTNSVAAAAVAAATDMFVNFDAISRNNLFSVNNISKLSNLLFDDGLTAPGLVMGSGQVIHSVNHGTSNGNGVGAVNYTRGNSVQNLQPPPPLTATNNSGGSSSNNSSSLFSDHQQFMFGVAADVERCCDRGVLNCFNGVWSNNVNDRKLLPVEE